MKTYDIKKVAEPTYHLGCNYQKLAKDGVDYAVLQALFGTRPESGFVPRRASGR